MRVVPSVSSMLLYIQYIYFKPTPVVFSTVTVGNSIEKSEQGHTCSRKYSFQAEEKSLNQKKKV